MKGNEGKNTDEKRLKLKNEKEKEKKAREVIFEKKS